MSNVYEPTAGENISEAAANMVKMAKNLAEPVTASFNDIALTANPSDDPSGIVRYYHTESERRHQEYLRSPERARAEEDARLRQEARDAECKAALATAPEHMTLRDADGWQKARAANTDPYGNAVMEYAERWARIMEGRIAAGAALAEIAQATSHIADNEGISGFMYGAAVSVLGHVWVHGEELRRWRETDGVA